MDQMVGVTSGDAREILEEAKRHCKPRVSLSTVAKERVDKTQQTAPEPVSNVQYDAKRLAMLMITVPFLSTSNYYDLLSFNYREGNAAKTEGIKKKLIIQHNFHSGRRGGKSVLLEPSKAAFVTFKMPSMYENPGFLHQYLQHKVKEAMTAQGYKATLEKSIKGKNVDVVLERDSEKIAVEIAVTPKHEVVNVRKDVLAGFSRIVIIGKDRKVVEAVKKKLSAAFDSDVLSKVRCCVLADFIDGKTE
ncbi:hypothetical protein ACFL6S_23080 [Candidatus Poribacteria bacterium]